jgi:hypothetical protein
MGRLPSYIKNFSCGTTAIDAAFFGLYVANQTSFPFLVGTMSLAVELGGLAMVGLAFLEFAETEL